MNAANPPKIEESFPLAPLQQGMLYHHLAHPGSGLDVEQVVCDLDEELDVDAFRAAWVAAAGRHPMLRAALRWQGVPSAVQEVHVAIDAPFAVEDWRQPAPWNVAERLEAFLQADRARGFDLSRPPLFRVTLARVGERRQLCVWTVHHVVCDGRSFRIVLGDVFRAYEARLRGQPALAASAPSFRLHLEGRRERDPAASVEFWRAQMAGVTPAPSPFTAPAAPQSGHGEVSTTLPAAAAASLRQLARESAFTPSTAVYGAWALLLDRHAGLGEALFGVTLSGRPPEPREVAETVGVFIHTVPLRVKIRDEAPVREWLRDLRSLQLAVRGHEDVSLVDIQRLAGLKGGAALFHTLIVFDSAGIGVDLPPPARQGERREFRLVERTPYAMTLYAEDGNELSLRLVFDRTVVDETAAHRALQRLVRLLAAMAASGDARIGELEMLAEVEREKMLSAWNATATDYRRDSRVHELVAEQAARTPARAAVVAGEQSLTYRELEERANRIAHRLRREGVGHGDLVGVCLPRGADLVASVLAVHKLGAAYVPLDPMYPPERARLVLEDARVRSIIAVTATARALPRGAPLVCLDTEAAALAAAPADFPPGPGAAGDIAYVIYTSGSTGRPKGVMVEHRNVLNFFAGMDQVLGTEPGVWLAVTSLAFDISVLELFWTLARGFTVVLQTGGEPGTGAPAAPIDFSLFYFGADQSQSGADRYRLVLEGARFADTRGFAAVWTPERHFHAFGGLYPNPAVAGAAIAAVTRRVGVRAGSVVLPLHDSIRVAEEWALVDAISGGRAGVSFASGWHPEDFALRPEAYAERKEHMYREIDTVKRLWRGESIQRRLADGKTVELRTLPRPVQPELPVWITTAGSAETWRRAGEIGANVLTHLLGQRFEDIAANAEIYRQARRGAGHAGGGHVTLMLHAFVADSDGAAREAVREPMKAYLRQSVSLVKGFADQWTAYSKRTGGPAGQGDEFQKLSPQDLDGLLEFAFERYFESSGLFGSPQTCLAQIDRARAAGVDEIACLIDFGVAPDIVLRHLELLDEVRERAQSRGSAEPQESLEQLIARHGVTHLQCTPSHARMVLDGGRDLAAFAGLKAWLVGGEALPAALAARLRAAVPDGRVINMYGPTETTVWSSVHTVGDESSGVVPIGRPIANTTLYVLDRGGRPAPPGVAGELYIGGEGVARGYYERPDLTRERFVEDRFGGAGGRLYRTGDLARWRDDGVLEFLGRADHQVKLRGHRIELGEIEAVLAQSPAVREAAVVVREAAPGDQRLVAYVVVHAGADLETLRPFLRERLPEVMVPSHFVKLEALPLTPNGKVDRNALPPLEAAIAAPAPADAGASEAANGMETKLAEIWREALRVPKVGRRDNFFDLGGHSLLAVQVLGKIREATGEDLPITDLFRFSTIESLARRLAREEAPAAAFHEAESRGAARRDLLARRRRS